MADLSTLLDGAGVALEGVDSIIRGIANGVTFGYADKFAGYMDSVTGEGTVAENIAHEQAITKDRGWVEKGGEVIGAVAGVGKLASVGGWALRSVGLVEAGTVASAAGSAAQLPLAVTLRVPGMAFGAGKAAFGMATTAGLVTGGTWAANAAAGMTGNQSLQKGTQFALDTEMKGWGLAGDALGWTGEHVVVPGLEALAANKTPVGGTPATPALANATPAGAAPMAVTPAGTVPASGTPAAPVIPVSATTPKAGPPDVFFATNSANLTPEAMAHLQQIAAEMKKDPSAHFTLSGFADFRGTKAFNDKLSLDRAESVKKTLIEAGVKEDQLSVKGMGVEGSAERKGASAEALASHRHVHIEKDTPVAPAVTAEAAPPPKAVTGRGATMAQMKVAAAAMPISVPRNAAPVIVAKSTADHFLGRGAHMGEMKEAAKAMPASMERDSAPVMIAGNGFGAITPTQADKSDKAQPVSQTLAQKQPPRVSTGLRMGA